MTLSQNEATRFISVIDYRIEKALGRGTVIEMTYGDVDAVTGSTATVFIGGDTNASSGFRIPAGMAVEVGDRVRVSIDPRGIRRVEEVLTTESYPRLRVDPVRGEVSMGDGTDVPTKVLELSTAHAGVPLAGGGIDLRFGSLYGAPVVAFLDLDAVAQSADIIKSTYDGEANPQFTLGIDGKMRFGAGGGSTVDTTLYRSAAGTLKTDGTFEAGGALKGGGTTGDVMQVGDDAIIFDGDVANRMGIKGVSDGAAGGIMFGSGKDTNIYRSAADTLKTDDAMHVLALTVNKDGSNESVITFPAGSGGNDPAFIKHIEATGNVGEMRFSASDDDVDTDFFSFGSVVGGTWREKFRLGTSGKMTWSGTALELDTSLYRDSANVLRLADGDKFVAPNIFGNTLGVTPVANTATSASETFPASKTMTGSLFGASSADTSAVGTTWLGESITSISSTSITMYGCRTNTTSTTMWYVVIGI